MFFPVEPIPIDTAHPRPALPMTVTPDWMGYEEYKKCLQTLNLTPAAYAAAIKDYCDRRGI